MTRKLRQGINELRYYDYNHLKNEMRFYFILCVIIIFIIMLISGILRISIFIGSKDSSIVFTVLNALVFGAFLNSLGLFNYGIRKKNWKYIFMFIFIIVMLLGFGYFNIEIQCNFWFLAYKTYSTSSGKGIAFFVLNFYLWFAIYFLSFLVEGKRE